MRQLLALGVLCLASLAAPGCAGPWPTAAERAASGQVLRDQQVAGQPLLAFLGARSAFLVAGAKPTAVHQVGGRLEMDLQAHYSFGVSRDELASFRFATIVALTEDGYFLSAAHSLRKGLTHYVCIPRGATTDVVPARVVWASDPDKGIDLAIIKADVKPPAVFEWATDDELRAGLGLAIYGPYGLGSGALQGVEPVQAKGTPPADLVIHNLPLVRGDSGGPLTTRTGKLVGINIGAEYAPLKNLAAPWKKLALRPDPQWVQQTIEQDRARQAAKTAAVGTHGEKTGL